MTEEVPDGRRSGLARTYLFVPGDQPRMFDKAISSGADAILIDLEDAVQPSRRAAAREAISSWVHSLNVEARPAVWVRLNSADSNDHPLDVEALRPLPINGVALPKCGDAGSFDVAERLPWPVLGIIETARGLVDLLGRSTMPANVSRLGFGSADFSADIGIEWSKGSPALLAARTQMVWAARALGLPTPVDTAFPWLDDPEGFATECHEGRGLGFGAKFCIHPGQVSTANACWTPAEHAVEQARRIIAAWEREAAEGRGAFRWEGQMVDEAVVKRARQIVELAIDAGHRRPTSASSRA